MLVDLNSCLCLAFTLLYALVVVCCDCVCVCFWLIVLAIFRLCVLSSCGIALDLRLFGWLLGYCWSFGCLILLSCCCVVIVLFLFLCFFVVFIVCFGSEWVCFVVALRYCLLCYLSLVWLFVVAVFIRRVYCWFI